MPELVMPEPEPEPEPQPGSPRTPGELESPFSHYSRTQKNFDSLVQASDRLVTEISGGSKRPSEHASSRAQKGGKTAMQHLVGDSSIVGELGTLLEHGGIYCEATVTIDEDGNALPDGGTRQASYIIHCGIIDILQSYGVRKQAEAMFKALFLDFPTSSVAPPPFYGRRFRVFLTERVFSPSETVGREVEVDMSRALRVPGRAAAATADATSRRETAARRNSVETIPPTQYSPEELERQEGWREQMRRRRELEKRKAAKNSPRHRASSSFQSLEESVRQTVVVALLAQEGDPRTKIGHWRVKDVGGVRQACFKNQKATELCYNIALGVHYLLQKDPPNHEPDPFSYSIFIPSLGDKDSGIAETNVPDFSFKIYKPNLFREVRAKLGIKEADFRNSLEATQQIGNPGASGSLLFKTADELYIVKTLEKNEYVFILGMLEKYVGHLARMGSDVESSLLCKFVGIFSIKKNRKIRLIAMQNSLPKQVLGQPVALKFDLKGSEFGRKASQHELSKGAEATLKDLDFDRVFPAKFGGLRIRPADYEKLAHRINEDARVLAQLEIIDHSLLLACYEIPRRAIKQRRLSSPTEHTEHTKHRERERTADYVTPPTSFEQSSGLAATASLGGL